MCILDLLNHGCDSFMIVKPSQPSLIFLINLIVFAVFKEKLGILLPRRSFFLFFGFFPLVFEKVRPLFPENLDDSLAFFPFSHLLIDFLLLILLELHFL